MNKEIKFRAKSKGEWCYGSYVYLPDSQSHHIIPCGSYKSHIDAFSVDQIEIDPETLGQYIGLKDRYDQEIYEGDVLLTQSPYGEYVGYVAFRYGSFCVLGIEPEEPDYDLSLADILAMEEVDLHPFCAPIWQSEMRSFKMHPCHECSSVIGNVFDSETFRPLPARHRSLTEIQDQMMQASLINYDFNRSVENDNHDSPNKDMS